MTNYELRITSYGLLFKKGFTVIELLIVIGITIGLVAIASPIYSNLQVSTQLNEAHAQITQDLRLAREQSVAGVNGVAHGIKFEVGQYTLFQGASYVTRNSLYDRVNDFSDALSISTSFVGNEVVFSTGLGLPNAQGVINVAHSVSGTRTVNVTTSGSVIE